MNKKRLISTHFVCDLWKMEPIRYLVIGVGNTILSYVFFSIIYYILSPWMHYLFIQCIATVVNVTTSYITYKLWVFRTRKNYLQEYLRFYVIYAPSITAGVLLFAFFQEVLHLNPYLSQAIITISIAIISFFGHKYYSFRQRSAGKI